MDSIIAPTKKYTYVYNKERQKVYAERYKEKTKEICSCGLPINTTTKRHHFASKTHWVNYTYLNLHEKPDEYFPCAICNYLVTNITHRRHLMFFHPGA